MVLLGHLDFKTEKPRDYDKTIAVMINNIVVISWEKQSHHQGVMTIISIYAPKNRVQKYMKQKLTQLSMKYTIQNNSWRIHTCSSGQDNHTG